MLTHRHKNVFSGLSEQEVRLGYEIKLQLTGDMAPSGERNKESMQGAAGPDLVQDIPSIFCTVAFSPLPLTAQSLVSEEVR